MKKQAELTDPNSCLNRAKDDEILFVLLSRDLAAAHTIRFWCRERVRQGKNKHDDLEIIDALECANAMEVQNGWDAKNKRRIALAEKKSARTLDEAGLREFNQLQTECFNYWDRTPSEGKSAS